MNPLEDDRPVESKLTIGEMLVIIDKDQLFRTAQGFGEQYRGW